MTHPVYALVVGVRSTKPRVSLAFPWAGFFAVAGGFGHRDFRHSSRRTFEHSIFLSPPRHRQRSSSMVWAFFALRTGFVDAFVWIAVFHHWHREASASG